MILSSILAALLPAGVDAVKSLAGGLARKFGGLSVDDEVKLGQAQVSKLEALSKLDNPVGTPSQWVVDLRAAFRYVAAGISILSGIYLMVSQPLLADLGLELIQVPFAFIFGERMLMNFKASK